MTLVCYYKGNAFMTMEIKKQIHFLTTLISSKLIRHEMEGIIYCIYQNYCFRHPDNHKIQTTNYISLTMNIISTIKMFKEYRLHNYCLERIAFFDPSTIPSIRTPLLKQKVNARYSLSIFNMSSSCCLNASHVQRRQSVHLVPTLTDSFHIRNNYC